MTSISERGMIDYRSLRSLAEKATPGPWEFDSQRMTDAPYQHDEYTLFDGEGRAICGTENSDYRLGLIETEYDEDGTHVWNEPSRRNMAFIAAANPQTVLSLLDENQALREALEKVAGARMPGEARRIAREALTAPPSVNQSTQGKEDSHE